MDYLKSEHLKFKRTISNKLIFIVPLITAIFAWLMGGYMGYQYMTLYWWYAFLLPGGIAILCSLSHRKEENAGKYYSVFSMPVNLSRFEFAKGIILVEKLLVSAIFLALLISISNIIAPATAVYSFTQHYRKYRNYPCVCLANPFVSVLSTQNGNVCADCVKYNTWDCPIYCYRIRKYNSMVVCTVLLGSKTGRATYGN